MLQEKFIIVEVKLIPAVGEDNQIYNRIEYKNHGKQYTTAGAALQEAGRKYEIFLIQKIYITK